MECTELHFGETGVDVDTDVGTAAADKQAPVVVGQLFEETVALAVREQPVVVLTGVSALVALIVPAEVVAYVYVLAVERTDILPGKRTAELESYSLDFQDELGDFAGWPRTDLKLELGSDSVVVAMYDVQSAGIVAVVG